MSSLPRRIGALIAVVSLALTGTAFTQPAEAVVDHDARAVTIGANWLIGQLEGGLIHYPQAWGGGADYGLSIDTGTALAAVGGHASEVSAIADAVAAGIDGYISGDAFGDTGSTYAGPVAKAAVFATTAGADPTAFGGVDLVSRLSGQVQSGAPITGRIADTSSFGDNANTLGQAFAVRALTTAGSAAAPSALAFLLEQQCSDGFFRLYFTADKTQQDQSCDGGVATGDSAPDTDATAIAVQQLLALGSSDQAVTGAIAAAESWLRSQQHRDGSFGGGTSTAAANANSTGLAGSTLGMLGRTFAAERAAVWIRRHQADDLGRCTSALGPDRGAVAYDGAALSAGGGDGITDATIDQWHRASAQALPVLRWAPAATRGLQLSGPTGYVRGGSRPAFRVSGLVPGESVCVSGAGRHVLGHAHWGGATRVRVSTPARTVDRWYSVRDRAGDSAAVLTRVLGRTALAVVARDRVARGTVFRVRVTGLAPAERVRLRWRGATVVSGRADTDGVFTRRITATGSPAVRRVAAWGQFPRLRHGSTQVVVVR